MSPTRIGNRATDGGSAARLRLPAAGASVQAGARIRIHILRTRTTQEAETGWPCEGALANVRRAKEAEFSATWGETPPDFLDRLTHPAGSFCERLRDFAIRMRLIQCQPLNGASTLGTRAPEGTGKHCVHPLSDSGSRPPFCARSASSRPKEATSPPC